jgi:hypothetical protein
MSREKLTKDEFWAMVMAIFCLVVAVGCVALVVWAVFASNMAVHS